MVDIESEGESEGEGEDESEATEAVDVAVDVAVDEVAVEIEIQEDCALCWGALVTFRDTYDLSCSGCLLVLLFTLGTGAYLCVSVCYIVVVTSLVPQGDCV